MHAQGFEKWYFWRFQKILPLGECEGELDSDGSVAHADSTGFTLGADSVLAALRSVLSTIEYPFRRHVMLQSHHSFDSPIGIAQALMSCAQAGTPVLCRRSTALVGTA